jgi:hypothetical protein
MGLAWGNRAGALFFDTCSIPFFCAIANGSKACRMRELLIETVSWLTTVCFIAAIITDTFGDARGQTLGATAPVGLTHICASDRDARCRIAVTTLA